MKKKFLILIIASFSWIVLFEVGARVLRSTVGDSLDKARVILEANKNHGWQQKPSMQADFMGREVITNQVGFRALREDFSKDSYKILVLGPSSAFGWGVPNEHTYASLIEKKLIKKKHSKVEVINASQIGFSTEQGRKLTETEWFRKNKPDLVIVSYGVNDIDRHRFYFQSKLDDQALFEQGIEQSQVKILNLTSHSAFLSLALRHLGSFLAQFRCPSEAQYHFKTRVSFKRFEENLEYFIGSFESKVLFLDTGHRYPSDSELENNEGLYQRIKVLSQKGDCTKANSLLAEARVNESYRVSRDLKVINKIIQDSSSKWGVSSIKGSSLLTEKDDFVDPIHPSIKGHQKIADALLTLLSD